MPHAPWNAVKALFDSLVDLPPPAREAALCDEPDAEVAAEVRSLLAHADAGDEGFLSQPAALAPAPEISREGERLGPWRLGARLGAGGMGDVWLARRDDGAYDGEAAVKLLRRGMDSAAVLARFAQEQQALARLTHPHIAHLLDAGRSADGLPYFVMERVQGQPIDKACEGRTLEQRLALFLQLADAVAHAHRKLLVHRDLKPSNVLVTLEGSVKLLDFGIAKALDPLEGGHAHQTQGGERPFTPHYASPEQVRGEPVSTATDVYSLGVLLYVMLTGTRPYGRSATTPHEAARSVLEEEPTRPSALSPGLVADPLWMATRRRLRGDLDNILLKALDKSVDGRYATVDALAADVRAFLLGYPVSAQPASWAYRMRKFVARHRAGTALGGLALLSVCIGLAAVLWQAREAQAARLAAEQRLAGIKKLTRDVVFRYGDAVTYLPGGLQVKEQMMLDSVQRLEGFATLVGDDPELRGDVATAWARLAYVQGDETTASLGKPEDAIRNAERAIATGTALVASREGDTDFMLWMSRAHTARGHALRQADRKEEAMASFDAAVALLERGLQRQPASRDLRTERATLRHSRAQLLFQPGNKHLDKPADALAQLQRARRELEALEAERHDVEVVYQLGTVVGGIHLVHLGRDEIDEAITTGLEAFALRRSAAEEDPSSIVYQDGLMTEANNIGFMLLRAGRPEEALVATAASRDAGLLLARQNGPASKWARLTRLYATSHGRALAGVGRHAEAVRMFAEAEAEWQRMQAEAPALSNEFRHAGVRAQRARSLAALGRRDEARTLLVEAAQRFDGWSSDARLRHSALLNRGEAALALSELTAGAEAAGWRAQARSAYESAQAIKPLVGEYARALQRVTRR